MKLLPIALAGLSLAYAQNTQQEKAEAKTKFPNYEKNLDLFIKEGRSGFKNPVAWLTFKTAHGIIGGCAFPGDHDFEDVFKPELITWDSNGHTALSQKEIQSIITSVEDNNSKKYKDIPDAKIINLAELAEKYGDKTVQAKFDKIKVIQKIKEEKEEAKLEAIAPPKK